MQTQIETQIVTEAEILRTLKWFKRAVSFLKNPHRKIVISLDYSQNSEEDKETSVVKIREVNPFVC